MRMSLKDLMDKLGVNRVLSPYEAHPWFLHDANKGLSCNAEVRMGPGAEDVEAEIQLLKDEDATGESGGGPQQILRMRILPVEKDVWTTKELWVRGEDFANKIYNWEEKGCDFFRSAIAALQMGEIPDFEELVKKELPDDDGMGGGSRGRIGRKSPKIKPGALLGMNKKGM